MPHALVTGGAGFVGSHLVDRLLKEGYDVRILDNLHPQIHGAGCRPPAYLSTDAEFVFADIADKRALAYALKGIDLVFHLAAETGVGQSMYEASNHARTNVVGTAALWDAICSQGKVERVILASSRAVYGEGTYNCPVCGRIRPGPRSEIHMAEGQWNLTCSLCGSDVEAVPTSENDHPIPTSVYGITKLAQEQLSFTLGRGSGIPVVALRFFNVYGSRQALSNPYTGILATFLTRVRSGMPLIIYEDGEQLRDFVHVQDVVQACLLAATHQAVQFRLFNVGSGEALSILWLARALFKALGRVDEMERLSFTGQYRVGDIRDCYADISAIRSALDYEPAISLRDGLDEFLDWADGATLLDRTDQATHELMTAGFLRQAYESGSPT